jgi:hypothetical protein
VSTTTETFRAASVSASKAPIPDPPGVALVIETRRDSTPKFVEVLARVDSLDWWPRMTGSNAVKPEERPGS